MMQIKQKTIILILIFSTFATLSCSAIAFEGFMCNLMGGDWITDDPIAREYYCFHESAIPAPATDLSEPSSEEPIEPDTSQGEEVFMGTTSLAELWQPTATSSQVIENTIALVKDRDGNVTGSLIFSWHGDPSSPVDWEETSGGALHHCVTEVYMSMTGTISGTLSDSNNILQIDLSYYQDIHREDCPSEDEVLEGSELLDAEITLTGDNLHGSVPDFFTFDAARQ
jgi:hypothetical protein